MIKYFILALLIMPAGIILGQKHVDVLEVGTSYAPKNTYEDAEGEFKFIKSYLNAKLPYVLDNGDVFQTKISLNRYSKIADDPLNMYIGYVQLGYEHYFNEKMGFRFAVSPKIASTLKDVDENDFLIPVHGLLMFKPNNNFTYGAGLFYSYEFFGHFLFPLIYVNWKINDNWLFHADFPSKGYLMYYPREQFKAGIYCSTSSTSIRLSEAYESAYIKKGYAHVAPFVDLYLTKNIVFRAKAGYSFMRALDMYANNDKAGFTISVWEFNDERIQLNEDIGNALFFDLSLKYRISY